MDPFRFPLLLLSSAAFTAAQPPAADAFGDHHGEPVALEHVVVTASPYARNQADVAQPTSVLAGRELLLSQSQSLGELLSGQPGVSSTYFGPGASRPVIRGLGGDRVRLLGNGTGVIDASVISPDHAVSLDPLLIERVEIVRGPATLLYGGSAVGGVVNVIDHRIHTARPASPFNARFEARTASVNDETSGGAVFEGGSGAFAWHVDGYRRTAGNVEIPGFAESAARRAEEAAEAVHPGEAPPDEVEGHIPNTALTADGGAFGFSLMSEQGYVGFAYSGHNTFYGVPAGAHAHGDEDEEHDAAATGETPDHDESVRIDLRQRRLDLQGTIIQPLGILRSAKFKLGLGRYRHSEFEGAQIGTVFRNRGYDARLELLHEPLGGFAGAIGWHASRSDFEAFGEEAFVPSSRTRTNALFIFEESGTGPVVWQLGARVERQAIDLRDGSGRSSDETPFSASTGLVWTVDESWTLGSSLSHASRAANAQELFAYGAHAGTASFEIGEPNLKRENVLALDLTLRKRTGFITGSVTVFAKRFYGYVYEQPTGLVAVEHDGATGFLPAGNEAAENGLPVYRFVQHDANFHGAELETIFHLHHGEQQRLDLTVGSDFVRARNTATNTDLPRITPARLKTELTWTKGALALGADVQFVGPQRRIAPLETPTDRYELIGASASYRFTFNRVVLDLYLRGTNLADREARMHTSFLKDVAPLPGRSIAVGLRATF